MERETNVDSRIQAPRLLNKRRGQLIMDYFDNLDNGPLNKNFKNEKKFIEVFFYI
jgi:hypothetical protein